MSYGRFARHLVLFLRRDLAREVTALQFAGAGAVGGNPSTNQNEEGGGGGGSGDKDGGVAAAGGGGGGMGRAGGLSSLLFASASLDRHRDGAQACRFV